MDDYPPEPRPSSIARPVTAGRHATECEVAKCCTCGDRSGTAKAEDSGLPLCRACADRLRWFRGFIAQKRGIRGDLVTMNSSLANDLVPDSFDMIEMVVALEKEFHVQITFDDAIEFETVADAIRHIRTRENAEQGAA